MAATDGSLEVNRMQHDKEMEALRQTNTFSMEKIRHENSLEIIEKEKEKQLAIIQENNKNQSETTQFQVKQRRLEILRLAKETLLENARSKPVDSREVTAQDIENFAETLETYLNK